MFWDVKVLHPQNWSAIRETPSTSHGDPFSWWWTFSWKPPKLVSLDLDSHFKPCKHPHPIPWNTGWFKIILIIFWVVVTPITQLVSPPIMHQSTAVYLMDRLNIYHGTLLSVPLGWYWTENQQVGHLWSGANMWYSDNNDNNNNKNSSSNNNNKNNNKYEATFTHQNSFSRSRGSIDFEQPGVLHETFGLLHQRIFVAVWIICASNVQFVAKDGNFVSCFCFFVEFTGNINGVCSLWTWGPGCWKTSTSSNSGIVSGTSWDP